MFPSIGNRHAVIRHRNFGTREVVSAKIADFSIRWAFGPSTAATSSKLRLADDKHHRQKSHITSTRTSLWFEGGCWGERQGREGRRVIPGRQDQYARYWAGKRGTSLSRPAFLSEGHRGPNVLLPAASSDTAKFSRAPIVPAEVPTRRKPIPMTSTDEEEEERETKERETCSKRGGEGGRRTRVGLRSDSNDTDDHDGRRRRRRSARPRPWPRSPPASPSRTPHCPRVLFRSLSSIPPCAVLNPCRPLQAPWIWWTS